MAITLLSSEIKLGNYGRVEIHSGGESDIRMVFKATGQEVELTPEDAYYLGNALILHASERGDFTSERGERLCHELGDGKDEARMERRPDEIMGY